ncbi:hypothetical protein SAMN05443572_12028 [Myxococcus fulvus]|nr:hypothetical protein SAMN05443572_12028 [Myxococcus fulvus]
MNITQKHLDDFKRLFRDDPRIQALTLEEVLENTRGKQVDWTSLQLQPPAAAALSVSALDDCQMRIGYVVFDAVCLAIGAVGLRATVKPQTIDAVAKAVKPVMSKLEVTIAEMASPQASKADMAWGVYTLMSTLYDAEALGAVLSAFFGGLSWWDMILYGITSTATIIAVLATNGLAFAAEVVLLLVTFVSLVSDSLAAVQACDLPARTPPPHPAPEAGTNPFPFEPVAALRTLSGKFLTVVNNGGLGGNVAIQTTSRAIGPWEKFHLVPINAEARTFALRTADGRYVTAVMGGGMGNPSDTNNPLTTTASVVGPWEKLSFVEQGDGTYAICTSDGYYLSALNGGGWGKQDKENKTPIHTTATKIREWETFTLERVVK